MIDATTVRPADAYLLPGRATKLFGYGYLFWLSPGNRRQFALVGYKGQYICKDPISKLVIVQTALDAPGADFNLGVCGRPSSSSMARPTASGEHGSRLSTARLVER
jgi:hypothetical protein